VVEEGAEPSLLAAEDDRAVGLELDKGIALAVLDAEIGTTTATPVTFKVSYFTKLGLP